MSGNSLPGNWFNVHPPRINNAFYGNVTIFIGSRHAVTCLTFPVNALVASSPTLTVNRRSRRLIISRPVLCYAHDANCFLAQFQKQSTELADWHSETCTLVSRCHLFTVSGTSYFSATDGNLSRCWYYFLPMILKQTLNLDLYRFMTACQIDI